MIKSFLLCLILLLFSGCMSLAESILQGNYAYKVNEIDLYKPEKDISDEYIRFEASLVESYQSVNFLDLNQYRDWMDGPAEKDEAVDILPVNLAHSTGTWIVPEGYKKNHRILLIHGGAFVAGSTESHLSFSKELAERTHMPLFIIDYRRMPEYRHIDMVSDIKESWDYIRDNSPYEANQAEKTFIVGDSAGANLALTLDGLMADKQKKAHAIALISPVTDMTFQGKSILDNREKDPIIGPVFDVIEDMPTWLIDSSLGALLDKETTDPFLSPPVR